MKQNLNVIDTMVEGLAHVQKQLNERNYSEAVQLMEDMIIGFTAVKRATRAVLKNIENTGGAEKCFNHVHENLNLVVTHLENHSYTRLQEIFQFTLIPNVKKLQRELEQLFQPYVLS
ncbi:hypothetical protein CHL76_11420 [Marinococcus halophilus]|uniref:DUF8042 domain-containing protein n=1 Tax=Marinococcus halophilus TaxID=1371 RepID=A0A510Y6W2_MARHA|nr:hypothetical protein [Marinococcus halophilus]OZT79738.1 hypothetical protein CHL76_11420 [Marinococcus halophilus]GEK59095.1 hypothetical protein MHA01_20000 [Marinococcus halophilus]